MSLETIVFNINEAKLYYGLVADVTQTRLIVSFILAPIFAYFLMSNEKSKAFIGRVFFPEAITMLLCLALIDMLIMQGAYEAIFVFLGVIGCFYIVFTNKKYKKHKELILRLVEKIF